MVDKSDHSSGEYLTPKGFAASFSPQDRVAPTGHLERKQPWIIVVKQIISRSFGLSVSKAQGTLGMQWIYRKSDKNTHSSTMSNHQALVYFLEPVMSGERSSFSRLESEDMP